jgi:predicted nucleic acid-binding protein
MQTVYMDTSVFGGCYDKEFKEYSNKLLNEFKRGTLKMMISNLVDDELVAAREEIRRKPYQVPYIHTILTRTPLKAYALAWRYIKEGALESNSHADAVHIATATLQGADVVASWNFKHMVNKEKIPLYNAINTDMGFRTIAIKTPKEIINPLL